jgi:hypothetical protein
VYPQERSDYMSGFYAGLFELSAAGEIALEFSSQPGYAVYESNPSILRVDVGAGRRLKLCFDNADWQTVASMDDLRTADVFFKRSYHAPYLAGLESSLRQKVLPMGLHYGCSSRAESWSQSVRDALGFQIATGTLTRRPLAALKRIMAEPLKRAIEARARTESPRLPLYVDEFEVAPDEPAQAKVFYRTRVYGPNDAPDSFRLGRMHEVNELRVSTVRALKSHFGERFVGGLRHSAYAQATYPDCVHPSDSGLRGHLALSRECLINVNTAGLHDSTSWKIPEYLAGSRCIVTEPMLYEAPVPLVEGVHYLAFSSAAECVAACDRILADASFARAMRAASFAYYSEHVRPDRLMWRCLQTALERFT